MSPALRPLFGAVALSLGAFACTFQAPGHDSELGPMPECQSDVECTYGLSVCKQATCENGTCVEAPLPENTPAPNGYAPSCQKVVCDGAGLTRNVPDPTAVPTSSAPACSKYICDAAGNQQLAPDPNHLPLDTPNDCKVQQCDLQGNEVYAASPSDTPVDQPGDCHRSTCGADGNPSATVDDTDRPPNATCWSYTCSEGAAVPSPINPESTCSDGGYVCGADGSCSTCPTPDAACTDPGPGTRTLLTAHDFEGIGRTDTGGRSVCGAAVAGSSEYYTYYDRQTGFLASFDPYFEVRPAAPAKLCVNFDCPSIACPAGTTSTPLEGQPGCCWDASAGVFTGHRIDFCDGGRVTLAVSSAAACTGFELHFHD